MSDEPEPIAFQVFGFHGIDGFQIVNIAAGFDRVDEGMNPADRQELRRIFEALSYKRRESKFAQKSIGYGLTPKSGDQA